MSDAVDDSVGGPVDRTVQSWTNGAVVEKLTVEQSAHRWMRFQILDEDRVVSTLVVVATT